MRAFVNGATDEFFASFHEDASFVVPSEEAIEPRSAYRAAWSRWEGEGVRFTDVVVDDVRVRLFRDIALVTHRIATTVSTRGKVSVDRGRESIIFARTSGRWLAIHHHLSPLGT